MRTARYGTPIRLTHRVCGCKETCKFYEGAILPKALKSQTATSVDLNEADARLDYLLDVAAQTFLEEGFEGTSVGDIAKRAHASKETYYSKFKNKEELFRRVIGRLMGRFASTLSATLETEAPMDFVLTSFADLILERILSDEAIGLQKIVYMEAARFPEVANVFFELGPQRTTNALIAYFSAQHERGNLRKLDADLAAAHFMGLLTSDLMMRKSLGMLIKPTSKERSYRVKAAVDVFLRAYGA
jgi:TetR/AcrR family transcriptional repressor of mexJK operon